MPFDPYAPAPGLESLEGTELAWIESHADDALALLLDQFKNKPRLEAVIRGLLAGVQDLENATWRMLTERSLENAAGVQLDGIGQIVNLPRAGWTDDVYRPLVRAQILTLRSSSTAGDLIAVLVALGFTREGILVEDDGMAAVRIAVSDPTELPDEVFAFLERARAAGVRLTFEYPIDEGSESFTFSSSNATAPAAFAISPVDQGPTINVVVPVSEFVGREGAPAVGDTLTDGNPTTSTIVEVTLVNPGAYELEVAVPLETSNDLTYSYSAHFDAGLGYGNTNDAAIGGTLVSVQVSSGEL